MDIKKLAIRTVSGVIYAGIIVVCIFLGIDAIIALGVLFGTLAVIEFSKISGLLNRTNIPILLLDIAGIISLCFGIYGFPIIIWIAIIIARFIEQLYIQSDDSVKSLTTSMMSQIYIGIPMGCMVAIADIFNNPMLLLALFIFIWVNDTGAFITGSLIGKHRLFERISPKKSWEGFFGGLLFNIGLAILFNYTCSAFFGFPAKIMLWITFAIIVTLFSTWGDLVESLIKRNLHIKDSGNLIPGHGGILDRIDSLLLVAPAVLIYLIILDVYFL